MKKHLRFIISAFSLLMGVAVVGVSLLSASQVNGEDGLEATQMSLYVDDQVLPDNVLYPFLMVADRARLESSTPRERVYLKIEYAQRRLEYSKELLEKDKQDLAFSTLTKSQKYVNQAAQDVLIYNLPIGDRRHMSDALEHHLNEVEALMDSFDNQDKTVVSNLRNEGRSIQEKLNHPRK